MKHVKVLGLLAILAMALVALAGTASASAAQFTAGQTGKALETSTLVQNVFTITRIGIQVRNDQTHRHHGSACLRNSEGASDY